MQFSPKNLNNVYFIGIGGVSMSSLASILLLKNKNVYGYDMRATDITDSLIQQGAIISFDENTDIPNDVDTIVYTAAMSEESPLMKKARATGANVLTRAELLGMIANSYKTSIGVSGTHGKSTTTGFIASVLLCDDENSTVLSGAMLPFINSYYKCGDGERIVYESCEYKNSYHSMLPSIKVILNCEHDHVDFFPTLDDVISSFHQYIEGSRFEGSENIAIVNADCNNSVKAAQGTHAEIKYYSITKESDYTGFDIRMENGYGIFSVKLPNGESITDIRLSVPGMHNVSNAVAAIAACHISGICTNTIKKGIENFKGVSRRFEKLGEYNGAIIVDDYAHHPDEIKVTLETARLMNPKRLICVFQPHTYSRTFGLLNDFASTLSLADKVYLCDIFPAREENIFRVFSDDIAKKMKNAECISDFSEIAAKLRENLREGDLCITMGAGRANEIAQMVLK